MNSDQNPAPFSFLVLADIHFGQFSGAPEFRLDGIQQDGKRLSLRDSLISTVRNLSTKPTALFVPGDLTSIASPSEFKGCVETVLGIADAIEISRDSVFFTYGNHDTNWRICELGRKIHPTEGKFPTDEHYNHVAATIGGLYVPKANCLQEGPVLGSGVYSSEGHIIFVLNSGFYCIAEQEYPHGRLGQEQLQWLETALNEFGSTTNWKILMVHHHPFNYTYPKPIEDISCIEEGAELVDLAGRLGIDFLFHGHRHHPRLFTESRTDWKTSMTFFCAGSVAVDAEHRDTGHIPNLFHIVSINNRLPNRAAFGNIISYQHRTEGWTPVQNRVETPLDHIHWFGCLTSSHEKNSAAITLIEGVIKSKETDSVILPSRNELSPQLLCCPIDELNSLLSSIAREHGFRIVGKYPDDVALLKSANGTSK